MNESAYWDSHEQALDAFRWGDLTAAGTQALDIMQSLDVMNDEKFARYLIGESLARKGDHQGALEQFETLQKAFFPQYTDLPETLVSVKNVAVVELVGAE